MSISSKINLQNGGRLEVTLDADLVHMDDVTFDFIMAVYASLREFEKQRKEPNEQS